MGLRLDAIFLDDMNQLFVTVKKVQPKMESARARLCVCVHGSNNHTLGEHRPRRDLT